MVLNDQQNFLVRVSGVIGLGGLVFGFNTGIIGAVIFDLQDEFNLDSVDSGLIVSILAVGSMCGCLLGGYLSDVIGRNRTTMIQDILYMLGSIILAFSTSSTMLLVGRFIVGVGGAFSAVATVPYLHEIAPHHLRGSLSSVFEMMIVFGIMIGSVCSVFMIGTTHGWRILFGIPSCVCVLQIIGLSFLPESPYWLAQQQRYDEARAALRRIYVGQEVEGAVEKSFEHVMSVVQDGGPHQQKLYHQNNTTSEADSESNTDTDQSKAEILKFRLSFIAIIVLMALGQLTGSVVVRQYAPTIFKQAGFSRRASLLFNVIVNAINVLVVGVSMMCVDRFGRISLLKVGFAVTAVGNAILVAGGLSSSTSDTSNSSAIMTFISGCVLSSAGFVLGFGPIGWVLSSELFSTKIRGRALSVSTLARNVFEFATSFMFPLLLASIHEYGTFALFFIFCLMAIVFAHIGLVETKQQEALQVLAALHEAPLWRMFRVFDRGYCDGEEEGESVLAKHHRRRSGGAGAVVYSPINDQSSHSTKDEILSPSSSGHA